MDEYGRTPLHYAAAEGRANDVTKLLAEGANPNAQDDNGWSPLHFAAQVVSADIARALLAAGANPELRDFYGNTVLWRAVISSRGRGEVVQLLREAGADPHAKNSVGTTPLSVARSIGNFNVAQFFSDLP